MTSVRSLFFAPLMPATGDTLRPLIIAMIVFGVAVVAIILYLILRHRQDKD